MGAVILLFITLSVGVVVQVIEAFGHKEIARSLASGRQSFSRYIQMRQKLLQDKGRSLAQAPYLKAIMSIDEVDPETAHYSSQSLFEISETDLLLLLDHEGRLLADATDPDEFGTDLGQLPITDAGFDGGESSGAWRYKEQSYFVTASPITDGDRILGLLILGDLIDQSLAEEIHESTGRDVLIFHRGALVAQSRLGPDQPTLSSSNKADLAKRVDVTTRGALEPIISFKTEDRAFLATAVLVDGVAVMLSRPLDHFTVLYRDALRWLIVVGLCMAILALAVSRVIAHRLSKPIQELMEASEAMAEGDLTVAVDERGDDELTRLSQSFNKMTRRIDSLVKDVKETAQIAESASQAKTTFLANMSHEIRTPLNAILGFSQLLHCNASEDEDVRRDWLATIISSGNHLLSLINEIMDLTKIDADRLDIEQIPCSPTQIINEVLAVLRPRVISKEIQLSHRHDGQIPATIETDPTRLRQLLMNLIGNAIKFTKTGSITVVTQLRDDGQTPKLRIGVVDTGVGISPQQIDKIFDPFVQADTSTTRKYGGTGLGLSISKRIAEALGGTLTVESTLGKGSTFTCEIDTGDLDGVPMIEDPDSQATVGEDKFSVQKTKTLPKLSHRILVVDDVSTNRMIIDQILRHVGAEVVEAQDGQKAIDLATSEAFDLILMDMQMPVMDGYTATRKLREHGLTCPIIALTAHAMKEDKLKCESVGCSGYLTKPVDVDQLLRVVASALHVSEIGQEQARTAG